MIFEVVVVVFSVCGLRYKTSAIRQQKHLSGALEIESQETQIWVETQMCSEED